MAGLLVLLLDDVTLEGVVDLGTSFVEALRPVIDTPLPRFAATLPGANLLAVPEALLCFNLLAFVVALRFSATLCGCIHSSYLILNMIN